MSGVVQFLTRRQGRNGQFTWTDIVSYGFLFMGFLMIFMPVMWLALNSVKSQFQLEKQDTSLFPSDYSRIARASVYGPKGREIFFIKDLPRWVYAWSGLNKEERADKNVSKFLEKFEGREFLALRSHFGLVGPQGRQLIKDKNLPEWMVRYPTMFPNIKSKFDPLKEVSHLSDTERRLLFEFLGVKPFKANTLTTQVLAQAPDPKTGKIELYALNSLTTSRDKLTARLVNDPGGKVVRLPKHTIVASKTIKPSWKNYTDPLMNRLADRDIDVVKCLTNSIFVTLVATLITLIINSMAAFALSKYRFRGQTFFFIVILATLMVPASIMLVGIFKMITATGLSGSLWGVIIPGAATPTGVFMLRQYMLTIPDELMEAARMDGASEWKVYWRIVLPLALPALAVLGILSIIWRWNDLILPLVAVATNKEAYTIQLCLLEFRGEYVSQEHYRLAMTIVSLIPTTLVFVFLQRYITTGIANTGMK